MDIQEIDPVKQARSVLDDFKAFAFKGNVVDLAVGVIIGGAFGKIVDSLVKSILMPLISVILPGEGGYQAWSVTIRGQTIPYGLFLAEVVNFLIVAFALFLLTVKFLGWVRRIRTEEEKAATPAMTKDQELLTEIRDLLKSSDRQQS